MIYSNKRKKAIVIDTIIIISILIAMCTYASAGSSIELSKNTWPDPNEVYNISDTIIYQIIVTNPIDAMYTVTLEVTDELPNGTIVQINPSLTLIPGQSETYEVSYTASTSNIINNLVINNAWVEGYNTNNEYVYAFVQKKSAIIPAEPSIDVEKYVSVDAQSTWEDADSPTGPYTNVGSDVYFKFVVTNTGNAALTDLTLTDTDYDTSSCTITSPLAPAGSFECIIGPESAIESQQTDTATATGKYNGDTYQDIDDANYFGNCTGMIGDFVWKDKDGDGIQDTGESGISGVELILYLDNSNSILDGGDTLLDTQITNLTGYYLFTEICVGQYIVEVNDSTIPDYYLLTTPPEPRAVELSTGEQKLDVDFGYKPPCPCTAAIGDHIWNDIDEDGIFDANEAGISGVMVRLYQDDNGDSTIDSRDNLYVIKVTGANGNYLFSELCDGEYIVDVDDSTLPFGVVLTTTPEPWAISLGIDQHILYADFGYAISNG